MWRIFRRLLNLDDEPAPGSGTALPPEKGDEWTAAPTRAGMVIVLDGRLLLVLAGKYAGCPGGNWSIPKGRIDWGESPFDAAHRELREECGIALPRGREEARASGSITYPRKGRLVTMEFFVYDVDRGLVGQCLGNDFTLAHTDGEVTAARFFSLDEAAVAIAPPQAALLRFMRGVIPGTNGRSMPSSMLSCHSPGGG